MRKINSISDINEKMSKLKELKLQVETKLARELYKKMENILGNDFSFHLVTVMIDETWNSASAEQREAWRSKAHTFSLEKVSKSSSAHQSTTEPTLS